MCRNAFFTLPTPLPPILPAVLAVELLTAAAAVDTGVCCPRVYLVHLAYSDALKKGEEQGNDHASGGQTNAAVNGLDSASAFDGPFPVVTGKRREVAARGGGGGGGGEISDLVPHCQTPSVT